MAPAHMSEVVTIATLNVMTVDFWGRITRR
jgi:hypothetical protein